MCMPPRHVNECVYVYRSIAYGSDEVESRTQARTSARTSRSVWTPDRETIDTQLGKIRRRVRSSL